MKEQIINIIKSKAQGKYYLEIDEPDLEVIANEILSLFNVSKSVAKQYAEFCVRCDREGLPLLELDDYIKQYCC